MEDHARALVTVEERDHEGEDDHAKDLEHHARVVDEGDEANAEDIHHRDRNERDDGDPPLVRRVEPEIPAHVVEGRNERVRQRRAHRGDGEDAGKEVDPAGEPRVRLAGQILRPLEDGAGDRVMARQLGEAQRDDQLPDRDDRPAPDEDAADGRQPEEEQGEDAGRRGDVAERDSEGAEDTKAALELLLVAEPREVLLVAGQFGHGVSPPVSGALD